MGVFAKTRKPNNAASKNTESVFDIRRKMSELRATLDAKTKENEGLKAALDKTEKEKMQVVKKVRAQIKHIKRLKNKIVRFEEEKIKWVAENTNFKTKARNSRERANRYKKQAEKP